MHDDRPRASKRITGHGQVKALLKVGLQLLFCSVFIKKEQARQVNGTHQGNAQTTYSPHHGLFQCNKATRPKETRHAQPHWPAKIAVSLQLNSISRLLAVAVVGVCVILLAGVVAFISYRRRRWCGGTVVVRRSSRGLGQQQRWSKLVLVVVPKKTACCVGGSSTRCSRFLRGMRLTK